MKDEEYMEQLFMGNYSALDSLIFRYHKPLYGYVYRLVLDENLTEDIIQETFLKIFQQGKKGFIPESFKPWAYKIATNLCKDYWRKASTKKEKLTDVFLEKNQKVYHMQEWQADRQWLIEGLNQLSLDYRTVLYLRFFQDMTYGEIAATLDISVNTVKTRVSRGLGKLEKLLRKNQSKGVGSSE